MSASVDIATHWNNIRVVLGLYEAIGKENGNYYNGLKGFRDCRGLSLQIIHLPSSQGDGTGPALWRAPDPWILHGQAPGLRRSSSGALNG